MEQTATTTTTTDRPASMDAALASVEASSASAPVADTKASDPAAATATTSPDSTEAAQVEPSTETTDPSKGEPPKWRWQDILDNARQTSAKEAETRVRQELDSQYGELKDLTTLDATERQGLLVLHRAMRGDAESRAMVGQAVPQLAQSMGWVKGASAGADESMPEADLQTGDGTPVYSATQQAKRDAWLEQQITKRVLAQFDERLRPVNEVISAHETAKAHHTVSGVLNEMRADPDFKANEADIKTTLQADAKLWALADSDPKLALELAWARVYRSTVLPAKEKAQKESAEASVLTNLQSRAVAGTTNPATTATATPRKPRSMHEALEQVGAA